MKAEKIWREKGDEKIESMNEAWKGVIKMRENLRKYEKKDGDIY